MTSTVYVEEVLSDRTRRQAQMQAYAACDDAEVCEVVRAGYGDLVPYAECVAGVAPEEITRFFAYGMLLNVIAAMDLKDSTEGWAQRSSTAARRTPKEKPVFVWIIS